MRSFYAVTESMERLLHGVQRKGWCSKELEHNELFLSLQLYVPLFLLWYTWRRPSFCCALEQCYTKRKRRNLFPIGKPRTREEIEVHNKIKPAEAGDKSDGLNREHGTTFFSPSTSVTCEISTMRQRTVSENVQKRQISGHNIHFHQHRMQCLTTKVMNSIPEEEDGLEEENGIINRDLDDAIFVGRC